LSADAVRRLASASGLDAAALYRLTGGNPFYVTEVLQAGMNEVPAAARDAVLARVARLSGQSRDVLDAAALIGTRSDLRLVESVTACPLPVLDEVLASGLLAEDGSWLRFRHEIARLAVEQAIAAHRRRALHARILAALEAARCDDDAQMAFHAEGAGDGRAALRYATAAAWRAAELASHREAAAQFGRALRFAAGTAPATAASLWDGLAYEAGLLDRWQDAVDAGEHALVLWRRTSDRLRESATLTQLSHAKWRSCRGHEAAAAAEAAVVILEPLGPSTELAWAYARLAGLRLEHGQVDASIGLSRRAQALAESLNVPEVLSYALNTQSYAAAAQGRDWATPMHRAMEIAVSGGLQAQAGRAYANLHALYCGQRRFDEAERCFAEGVAYCDEHDIGAYRLQAAGDWDAAARLWTGLGCPYEAALALYDAPEEAALREALKIFTDLGASAAAQITRQKMRLLGARSIPTGPRTATRAHPLGLTRREREVLDLICAGHTNAQIAAKLFISTKTVDHHVSAVLAKLDAPTRNAAAAHAARLGLAGAAKI
jgi:DNA-binding CsgD family transcriptional regulator